jgi:hypothetical protein
MLTSFRIRRYGMTKSNLLLLLLALAASASSYIDQRYAVLLIACAFFALGSLSDRRA